MTAAEGGSYVSGMHGERSVDDGGSSVDWRADGAGGEVAWQEEREERVAGSKS
jgi:hypothetical protein